ncbi:MAG: fused response regulator/phosphatase [Sporomusaceae bacterium]|nr:fused response regulator/phosphatase [Sporomusaceae bacterium]
MKKREVIPLYKILVVDDVRLNRRLISSVLSTLESVTFLEAEDGFKAMEALEREPIDLVILDLMMPGKDGYQVLEEVKANEDLKDIPVIVYSAMDDIESIGRALELGAYDYFTKPLTPQQMKVIVPIKVKNALESYSQKKELMSMQVKMQLERMLANVFHTMLMTEVKNFPSLQMFGKYVPCQDIGGVFYDCVQEENKVWFIMAEMSGQGVTAAMTAAMGKIEFAHSIKAGRTPAAVLEQMNQSFYQMLKGAQPFDAFVGVIEGETLTWANGGNCYPLFYSAKTDTALCLHQESCSVGQQENVTYTDEQKTFLPGDMLLISTEGLFDAMIIEEEKNIGEDLQRYFMSYKYLLHSNPQGFFDTILNLVGNVQNQKIRDDIAVMVLQAKA